MNQLKLIALVIFAFVVVVFAVSNPTEVPIDFFRWTIIPKISLAVIVLGAVAFGVVISAILGFLLQTKLKKQISKLTKENIHRKSKEEKLQLKIRELEEDMEDEVEGNSFQEPAE